MRHILFAVPVAILLAACSGAAAFDGRSASEPVYRLESQPRHTAPMIGFGGSSLLDRMVQRRALESGCQQRYEGNPSKLRRCLHGDRRLIGNALVDGCRSLSGGNPFGTRRCLERMRHSRQSTPGGGFGLGFGVPFGD